MEFDLATADRQRLRGCWQQGATALAAVLLLRCVEGRLPSGGALLVTAVVAAPAALWLAARQRSDWRRVTVDATGVRLGAGGAARDWTAADLLAVEFSRQFDVTLRHRDGQVVRLRAPEALLAPWVQAWFPLWWQAHDPATAPPTDLGRRRHRRGLLLGLLLGFAVSGVLPLAGAGSRVVAGLLTAAGCVWFDKHLSTWRLRSNVFQLGVWPLRRTVPLTAVRSSLLDLSTGHLTIAVPQGQHGLRTEGDWATVCALIDVLPGAVDVECSSVGGSAWWGELRARLSLQPPAMARLTDATVDAYGPRPAI